MAGQPDGPTESTAEGEPGRLPAFNELPEPIRRRIVACAAAALPALDDLVVPAALRRFRSFTPARRPRLAAPAIGVALTGDSAFRTAVADWLRREAQQVAALAPPPAGAESAEGGPAVEDAAAFAWLAGAEEATELLSRAQVRVVGPSAGAGRDDPVGRLRAELAAARADARSAADAHRAELAAAKRELQEARRAAREAGRRERTLESRLRAVDRSGAATLDRERAASGQLARELAVVQEELRLAQAKVAGLQAEREVVRRDERSTRRVDELRLRLLLDTLVAAARGLARELALPPAEGSPADVVAASLAAPVDPFAGLADRTLEAADVAFVDRLLGVPGVHLVVDGYNVTKTGYPDLTLTEQRARLLSGLGPLAARTGAEVTCVFDGTARPAAVPSGSEVRSARLRVLFSPPGVLADEVIVALVQAEPAGRPLLVVTSDAAVATAARATGARILASPVLLARLERA